MYCTAPYGILGVCIEAASCPMTMGFLWSPVLGPSKAGWNAWPIVIVFIDW
jgi:hypothetical protein